MENNGVKVNELSIEVLKNELRKDGELIRFVEPKKQTEELQIISVENSPFNIKYIDKPTKKVQLLSVKKNKCVYKHINNPYQEIKDFVFGLEK